MTYTHAELRNRVAEDLGIKASDVELADEDASKIDARIESLTAEMRESGLIWWADDAVPDACVNGMSMMLMALCAASVGRAGQGYEAGYEAGRARIVALKPSAALDTKVAEYF